MRHTKASKTAIISIFIAVMIVINVLTQLVLPVWPFPIRPTFLHIPVIIGSILLGPRIGAFLGFIMGLISTITATIVTSPTSFLFSPLQPVPGTNHGDIWALAVAIIPRIFIGIIPYYVYKALDKRTKLAPQISGFTGSFVNTIFTLSAIFIVFGHDLKWSLKTVLATIVGTNSIAEAIIAAILTGVLVPRLKKFIK